MSATLRATRWSLLVLAIVVGAAAVATLQTGFPFPESLDGSRAIPYVIGDGSDVAGFQASDGALARWAMEAWSRAAEGRFRFEPGEPRTALIRVEWISPAGGLYGEMRPFVVGGRRGAVIFVMPDVRALGPDVAARAERDPLFRDTVVYLTCLHELGHGLGLAHTADYDDIMYFFGHGEDIPGYFQRYRDRLTTRDDIRRTLGLSDDDVRRVRERYPVRSGPASG